MPTGVETLKASSRHLRGGLAEDLAAGGRQVTEDSYNLLKFFGSYEQFDRDTATALKQKGQEKDYSFMIRVRMPGGRLTAAQYLALDAMADSHANGTLRVTTRQTIQFHTIVKSRLKSAIATVNDNLLTTMAACGDVVRQVMTSPAPIRDAVHARLEADANHLSNALLPQTRAYHEIFLDEEKLDLPEQEPLYGETYLPRKFKIALAIPQDNTVDVLTNDLGFLAIFEGQRLVGYNIAIGGGLGMTHNRADTFPRLADIIGAIAPDGLEAAAKAVIAFQRDHGDRTDRKRARLKYVLHDRGVAWVVATLTETYGLQLRPALPMPPLAVPELLGWHEQGDGLLWLGVPVPSGRIAGALRAALREVVRSYGIDPVMTPQQDVLLTNIRPDDREAVEAVLRGHGVVLAEALSPLARWTLACPALPTCGLALTEAERVQPSLVATVEAALARQGLAGERVSLRITGCPNGCARTYTGDIGLVGRMPGHYALYVGGDFEGTQLSERLLDRVREADIGPSLEPLFAAWASGRLEGEAFGAFCRRQGLDALRALLPVPSGKAA
jgi:sulfite reductase (ferredoxin)